MFASLQLHAFSFSHCAAVPSCLVVHWRRRIGLAITTTFEGRLSRTVRAVASQLPTSTLVAGASTLVRTGPGGTPPRTWRAVAAGQPPGPRCADVDAVGAFNHVSRQTMLGAPLARPALCPLVPYVRRFYGSPSSYYCWVDDCGALHEVAQGEGWEQGDPLMPPSPKAARRRQCL